MAAVIPIMTTTVITSSIEDPRSFERIRGKAVVKEIDIADKSVARVVPTTFLPSTVY